jgi:drug/metabolite transporter (DMT)-like permease
MAAEDRAVGVAYLLTGMVLVGSATPISKLVGEGFPIFTASFLRVLLGAIALFPLVYADLGKEIARIKRGDWLYLGLISLFGMVGFTLFLIFGMKFISGVAGSLIMSFTPALTAMAAWLFMRSPLGWPKIIAIALGVAGIVVLNIFKAQFGETASPHFYLGIVLVLAAISCEACYTLIGKKTTEHLPPVLTSFLACALSLPLFLVLAATEYGRTDFAAVSLRSWLALIWWGVGTLAAGSALWYSGVARADGATAAGFMAIMPASALLLSYFLLGESFQDIHLLGIALVMGSVIIMSWVHMNAHGSHETKPSCVYPCHPCESLASQR